MGVGDVPMCDLEEQDNDTVRKEQRGLLESPLATAPPCSHNTDGPG